MKMTKRIIAALLITCTMLSLAACGGGTTAGSSGNAGGESSGSATSGSSERKYKDMLVVAFKDEPSTLDATNENNCEGQVMHLYDTLLSKDTEGNIGPRLATKWELEDDTTIIFHLRDDVVFHNGAKMTADDVVFSLQRMATTGPNKAMYKSIDTENTEAVDEYTVRLKLLYPFAGIYNMLSCPFGAIQCKSYVEEVGEEALAREPVGTGPFKLKEWKPGQYIDMERFDDYWGEKPTYKVLRCRWIIDGANRTIELESGTVDVNIEVQASELERTASNPDINMVQFTGRRYTYITLNMKDEVFADERVRLAVAHALNMEQIVNTAYPGVAVVADSIMNPLILGYKQMGVMEYNPEKAKELLKEAGYENGLQLEFKTDDNPYFIAVAEIMRNMLKQVGIELKITIMEKAAFNAAGAAGEVQVGMSYYTTASWDPDQALQTWKSNFGGQIQGCDPKIDEMLLIASQEWDTEKRAQLYNEAIDYMWNTHYMIPVCFNDVIYATRTNVENLPLDPGYIPCMTYVDIYEE